MTRLIVPAVFLLLSPLSTSAAAGQDALQKVKELYAAAAYEDALAAAGALGEEAPRPQVEQYRMYCLIALGRDAEAEEAIERLVEADPLYAPDPIETPPRVQEAFVATRQQVLPDVARQMYVEAKAALDRQDRAAAIEGFDTLLRVIDSAPALGDSFRDLRLLADGFLNLSRALPAPVPATPVPAPGAAGTNGAGNGASSDPTVSRSELPVHVPPKALKQELPPWAPSDPVSRRVEFSGSVRVRVTPEGRVGSVEIVDSIHPVYDAQVLRAARDWLYQPATLDGVAVPSEVVVEVRLRPIQ